MRKELSIIGFGRFGQLAAEFLKEDFHVFVSNRSDKRKEADKLKVKFVSFEEAASKDIIVLSVPISEIKNILEKIKHYLKRNALVLDTCSVKEYPVNLMKKILPKNVEIIGTHPLFGPDSVKDSLKGAKIALCPVRIKNAHLIKIKKYLMNKELRIIEASPEEHDKKIAKTLYLKHFIGRALLSMNLKEEEIDTLGYIKLLEIINTVSNDTEQLFYDMHHYNKYAKNIGKDLEKSLMKINKRLKCLK